MFTIPHPKIAVLFEIDKLYIFLPNSYGSPLARVLSELITDGIVNSFLVNNLLENHYSCNTGTRSISNSPNLILSAYNLTIHQVEYLNVPSNTNPLTSVLSFLSINSCKNTSQTLTPIQLLVYFSQPLHIRDFIKDFKCIYYSKSKNFLLLHWTLQNFVSA